MGISRIQGWTMFMKTGKGQVAERSCVRLQIAFT